MQNKIVLPIRKQGVVRKSRFLKDDKLMRLLLAKRSPLSLRHMRHIKIEFL